MARFDNPATSGSGSSTDTFDKIYVTHNSDGQNVRIGDDAWIGDVDQGNHISIQGIQDTSQGGVILGSSVYNKIYSNSTDLTVSALNDVLLSPGSGYAYLNSITESQRIAVKGDIPSVGPIVYGAFHDENSFGPYAANSEQALSYESTDAVSDTHIGGINSSEIIVAQPGVYNLQFSTQFHATSGGAVVYIWLKKNGTTLPWTGTRFDITANNPYAVAAWNWFVTANANDAFEIFWSSPSSTVKVEALTGLTGTKASVPSNIATITKVS